MKDSLSLITKLNMDIIKAPVYIQLSKVLDILKLCYYYDLNLKVLVKEELN